MVSEYMKLAVKEFGKPFDLVLAPFVKELEALYEWKQE